MDILQRMSKLNSVGDLNQFCGNLKSKEVVRNYKQNIWKTEREKQVTKKMDGQTDRVSYRINYHCSLKRNNIKGNYETFL